MPKLSYFSRLWTASIPDPKSNNPVPKSISNREILGCPHGYRVSTWTFRPKIVCGKPFGGIYYKPMYFERKRMRDEMENGADDDDA